MRKKPHVIGNLFENILQDDFKTGQTFQISFCWESFHSESKRKLRNGEASHGYEICSVSFHLISFHFIWFHPIFVIHSTDLTPSTDENLLAEFPLPGKHKTIHYWGLSTAVIPNLQNTASTTTTTSWARVLRQLLWKGNLKMKNR